MTYPKQNASLADWIALLGHRFYDVLVSVEAEFSFVGLDHTLYI